MKKKTPCIYTRSLGPLWGPISSLWPFRPALGPSGLLDFVLRALQALRPCDPCPYPSQANTITRDNTITRADTITQANTIKRDNTITRANTITPVFLVPEEEEESRILGVGYVYIYIYAG